MKKAIIILGMAIALVVVPSQAQFLKKLGKALDKVSQAVDKAVPASSNNDPMNRQIGNAVKLGDMTMTAFGDNPGIGFTFGSCYRENGNVYLVFQYPNQSKRDIENVGIYNYEPNETFVYGPTGNKYNIAMIGLGDSRSSEGVSVNIPAGGFANGYLVITGVPADVNNIGKVIFNSAGQYVNDAIMHRYRFVLDNVAITEPANEGSNGSSAAGEAAPEDGVKVAKGMPLADTLRKLGNVTYDYNADSGIWASAGTIAIVIDEDQLTPQGTKFINSLTSDIEPNIDFKPEYVKPDAVVKHIEKL